MSAPGSSFGRFLRAFFRSEDGASAAEFALVLPVFLLTVFSTMYLSMLLGAVSNLHAATEQAARCLAVNATTCTSANINTYATGRYKGPRITGLTFTASTPACGSKVTGTGTFSLFTGLSRIGVNLSATACYPTI